ncbi:hypothetical protein [Aliarcobacter butzleri]|uniref:hypothetical protein n=1 Tax=Aliarcobacter butzleri TaxID=28197 RepID=UPI0021B1CAD3|nr:hypothetical protein [Aliarcobacter butzleri]MCT7557620.1 hypothetical protein [Aliarcobacter butzleri]
MEISTNNTIYTAIQSSQTTITQNTNSSFNTLVNTQTQDTPTTNSTNNKVFKKINDFLDAHNGYSSLSPTDEKIFRDILSDNKLTKEEANSLSFEQVERITTLLLPSGLSDEEINSMPIVQQGVDLFSTRATGNRQFNEAFYNTLKEIDSPMDANKLEGEVYYNLGELYNGAELRATFAIGSSANPWEFRNMDADFEKFIKDVINHHEAVIADPKVDDIYKKQHQDIVDLYSILEKNYNQVLSKTKYA